MSVVAMKTGSLTATRRGRLGLELLKKTILICREVSLLELTALWKNPICRACCYLTSLRTHSMGKPPSRGHFPEIISSNDLILQLPEVLIPGGEDQGLAKNLKEKAGK